MCQLLTEEKKQNLKVVSWVLFKDLTEDYSLGDSLSDSLEELFQSNKEGARIYRSFFVGEITQHIVKHEKITTNQKNRHLKLITLVLFYVWEDARI